MCSEPTVFGPPGFAASLDELTGWLLEQQDHARAPNRARYRFAVELLEDESVIGSARIFIEDAVASRASIGYALARAHRGKGYATEAATAGMDFTFGVLGIHTVEASIEPGNAASVRVAEKLGMTRGELVAGAIDAGPGPPRDAWRYRIDRDRWSAR